MLQKKQEQKSCSSGAFATQNSHFSISLLLKCQVPYVIVHFCPFLIQISVASWMGNILYHAQSPKHISLKGSLVIWETGINANKSNMYQGGESRDRCTSKLSTKAPRFKSSNQRNFFYFSTNFYEICCMRWWKQY